MTVLYDVVDSGFDDLPLAVPDWPMIFALIGLVVLVVVAVLLVLHKRRKKK